MRTPKKPPPCGAPKNLDELRSLLSELQSGAGPLRLGSRSFQTLAGLVDAPRQTAVYSISELASAHNVNASTLTRLAKRLGFHGFSDFQGVFRRHIAAGSDFYSRRAGELLRGGVTDSESIALLSKIAQDESANIAAMIDSIDPARLEATVRMIAQGRAIRVHGLRQFHSIACGIAYTLGMIRNDVALLGDPGHGVAHALAQLEAGDVLIVMGSTPYTRATVDACEIAAAHGMRIIALTDSYASPFAKYAEQVFITPTGGVFFGNSTAACLIFAEGLMALVARTLGQHSVQALKRREALIDQLGVAVPSPDKPSTT